MKITFEETNKRIEELQKYIELEGSELGEAWAMLCEIHNRGDYLSESFKNAIRREIKKQYDYVKKHAKIVKRKSKCFNCNNGLVDVIDLEWDD